jgi:hypothetical protein
VPLSAEVSVKVNRQVLQQQAVRNLSAIQFHSFRFEIWEFESVCADETVAAAEVACAGPVSAAASDRRDIRTDVEAEYDADGDVRESFR